MVHRRLKWENWKISHHRARSNRREDDDDGDDFEAGFCIRKHNTYRISKLTLISSRLKIQNFLYSAPHSSHRSSLSLALAHNQQFSKLKDEKKSSSTRRLLCEFIIEFSSKFLDPFFEQSSNHVFLSFLLFSTHSLSHTTIKNRIPSEWRGLDISTPHIVLRCQQTIDEIVEFSVEQRRRCRWR